MIPHDYVSEALEFGFTVIRHSNGNALFVQFDDESQVFTVECNRVNTSDLDENERDGVIEFEPEEIDDVINDFIALGKF